MHLLYLTLILKGTHGTLTQMEMELHLIWEQMSLFLAGGGNGCSIAAGGVGGGEVWATLVIPLISGFAIELKTLRRMGKEEKGRKNTK